jgi:dTMP kinase
MVQKVGNIAIDGVTPDCTFLLDLEPAAALARMERKLDRVESRGAAYRERLRAGFLAEAAAAPGKIHVIAADRPVDVIQDEIQMIASNALKKAAD